MDVLIDRVAGLDVHRDTVVAAVRAPGRGGARRSEVRTFATTGAGLTRLADWLTGERVSLVGMESTGVYWKPVFYLLENSFECWLLNAQHMHNVPGRKTDVGDSVWIAQLLEHGLVRPSFVPPKPIRALRDLTRHRRTTVEDRTRAVQRLEKIMQDCGITLTSVASELLGTSGRAMIDAMLAGEEDPDVLADLARRRLRVKIPQLREALAGRPLADHQKLLVRQLLAQIDLCNEAITEVDHRIEVMLAPFADLVERVMTIPGVGRRTAECLIAEAGMDMGRFRTAGHLASWAGICPGNHSSAGTSKTGRSRQGSTWLRTALTEAAHAAAMTRETYLAAHYAQVRGRRGVQKAVGAIRHDILIAYWHIVHDGTAYRELGPDWAQRRRGTEAQQKRLVAQLEKLGLTVTVEPEKPAA
ncbi:IS110 family transposase [Frankia sp. CIT1]|uniref:IS110 family transposase n=2 Tax=unclassified Frankia TaxID=2632575 RepID=UPI001EF65A0A|nr:IS110 family transposase [Frankia sp. CIT1]